MHPTWGMTIQPPPSDETPLPPRDEDEPRPIDTPDEPEQRAPGADQAPIGAPRDEPDPNIA
jgi:hypothetical protein